MQRCVIYGGLQNKLLRVRWLERAERFLSQFWGPEVQTQGVGRVLLPLKAPGRILPASFSFRWPTTTRCFSLTDALLQSLSPFSLVVPPVCPVSKLPSSHNFPSLIKLGPSP